MTVRYAKREEMEAVNRLRRSVSELHAQGRPDIFRAGFCEELQRHAYDAFASEKADVIVAEIDETVCGFALVQYIDRPASPYCCACRFYHIEEFGVDAAYRRRGAATAIMEFCRREAEKKGFARLELDVWAFNAEAMKFYEAIGFRPYRFFMEQTI